TDHHFDLFLSDSDEYHFTDTIIVQKTVRGYRIVDGFEIINAGLPDHYQLPAVCFPENASLLTILRTLVEIKLKKRRLFPIEIARVFQMTREHGISDAKLMESLFSTLGLKSDESLIEQYLLLLSVNEPIINYLIDKNAPLKTWLLITKFNQADQSDLHDLIRLRPTLSVFEEIVISLYEIQKRENLTQKELLTQLRWTMLLTNENLESKEQIGQVRNAVFRRRFPLLSIHKDNVEMALRQISLPENARIHYDETFEKKELVLHWRLSTETDIKKMRDFYTEDAIQKIQQLLDIL
ncbi:MAG: hypothetical protein Q7J65_01200, partial [Candidatus Marinimicrobia bacterium]|nr:hypothetical protein [Candidatus Neomarinimicrobiota bacterium]